MESQSEEFLLVQSRQDQSRTASLSCCAQMRMHVTAGRAVKRCSCVLLEWPLVWSTLLHELHSSASCCTSFSCAWAYCSPAAVTPLLLLRCPLAGLVGIAFECVRRLRSVLSQARDDSVATCAKGVGGVRYHEKNGSLWDPFTCSQIVRCQLQVVNVVCTIRAYR